MTQAPKRTLAHRIDWLFTRAVIAAACALGVIVIFFAISVFVPDLFAMDFGFETVAQSAYTVILTTVIGVFAGLPFFSLPYLISGLFSNNAFDSKGLTLSTVAVISSALALMFSIDQNVCNRVAGVGGNCAPYQLAYAFDQFSKGGFADIFDIYDLEISVISTSELDWLGKLFTLNFRMISAIYLAMILLAILRRFHRKDTA